MMALKELLERINELGDHKMRGSKAVVGDVVKS